MLETFYIIISVIVLVFVLYLAYWAFQKRRRAVLSEADLSDDERAILMQFCANAKLKAQAQEKKAEEEEEKTPITPKSSRRK